MRLLLTWQPVETPFQGFEARALSGIYHVITNALIETGQAGSVTPLFYPADSIPGTEGVLIANDAETPYDAKEMCELHATDFTPVDAGNGRWFASIVLLGPNGTPLRNDRSPGSYEITDFAYEAAFNFWYTGKWDGYYPVYAARHGRRR